VLFVSHDLGLVKQLSNRAILLVGGRIHAQSEPNQVINQYIGLVLEKQRSETEPRSKLTAGFRHGDLTSEVLEVQLLGERGEPVRAVSSGEALRVRVRCVFHQAKADPMVGILIRNRIGMDVYGTNTRVEQVKLGEFEAGDELELEFRFDCWLGPQQYTLTVATQNADGSSHDWLDDVLAFEVVDARQLAGVANLRAQIAWQKKPAAQQRALR